MRESERERERERERDWLCLKAYKLNYTVTEEKQERRLRVPTLDCWVLDGRQLKEF